MGLIIETAHLICFCLFVFKYVRSRFSQEAAHILCPYQPKEEYLIFYNDMIAYASSLN